MPTIAIADRAGQALEDRSAHPAAPSIVSSSIRNRKEEQLTNPPRDHGQNGEAGHHSSEQPGSPMPSPDARPVLHERPDRRRRPTCPECGNEMTAEGGAVDLHTEEPEGRNQVAQEAASPTLRGAVELSPNFRIGTPVEGGPVAPHVGPSPLRWGQINGLVEVDDGNGAIVPEARVTRWEVGLLAEQWRDVHEDVLDAYAEASSGISEWRYEAYATPGSAGTVEHAESRGYGGVSAAVIGVEPIPTRPESSGRSRRDGPGRRCLVLTRERNESVTVLDSHGEILLRVEIHRIGWRQCRLAFFATDDIRILRTELLQRRLPAARTGDEAGMLASPGSKP